jgi:3-oxoacyl-[acyl-carrier protein] reductase
MSQKVACITGVSSGIGQALKSALEQDGWKVVGFARHLPMEDIGYELDLARLEFVEPASTRAGEEHGPIDAFFHLAGVWHDEDHVLAGKHLGEFTTEEIVKTMNVGLTSAMVMTARLLPFMKQGGHLVYISGTFTDGGANWLPYYTSKRGLEDFVQGLTSDQPALKVFGVSPGATATEAYKKFYPDNQGTAQSPESVAKVCMGIIDGSLNVSTGTVVQVCDGKAGVGFHS